MEDQRLQQLRQGAEAMTNKYDWPNYPPLFTEHCQAIAELCARQPSNRHAAISSAALGPLEPLEVHSDAHRVAVGLCAYACASNMSSNMRGDSSRALAVSFDGGAWQLLLGKSLRPTSALAVGPSL